MATPDEHWGHTSITETNRHKGHTSITGPRLLISVILVQCVTDVLSEFCRCVMCNKKVCSPARSPQRANHPGLSEVDFLLLMWFLLYCLFVLPHMDIRTISRFLLNLDEWKRGIRWIIAGLICLLSSTAHVRWTNLPEELTARCHICTF